MCVCASFPFGFKGGFDRKEFLIINACRPIGLQFSAPFQFLNDMCFRTSLIYFLLIMNSHFFIFVMLNFVLHTTTKFLNRLDRLHLVLRFSCMLASG